MADIFSSVLRGVRTLPIIAISSFTFYKCNEWFMKHIVDAQIQKYTRLVRQACTPLALTL
jgi:hypothetical protein